MKIITKNKQRECVARLNAIRRITDDMNHTSCFDDKKLDIKKWEYNMGYLTENIIEIAEIIGGMPAIIAIQKDLEKELKFRGE